MGVADRAAGVPGNVPGHGVLDADEGVTEGSHSVTGGYATVTGDLLYHALLSELERHAARDGTVHGYSTVMKRVFTDLGLGTGTGRVLRTAIGTYSERVRQTGTQKGRRIGSRSPRATEPDTWLLRD